MAEPNASAGSAARKIKWLGIGVVIAILLYSALWMFLASRLDRTVVAAIAQAETSGTAIECADRDVRGYPFRLGLSCGTTALATEEVRATAGHLRTAAQVYDPGRVIGELDGPLAYAGSMGDGTASWADMRASGRFGLDRLNLATLTADDVAWRGTWSGLDLSATIDRIVASVRPNGADLDAALTIDDMDPAPVDGRDAPAINLRFDGTLSGAAGAVTYNAVPVESLRGRTIAVRALDVALQNGGRLAAEGELVVDGDGLASGTVEIGFSDLAATVEAVAALVPEYAAPLRTAASVLDGGGGGGVLAGLLGNGRAETGTAEDDLQRATITLDRGRARLGVIPLGIVPPLP